MRESSETFNETSAGSEVTLYEGVLVKLRHSDDILYVKGIFHPPGRVIAFPRYVIREGKIVKNLKTYKEQIQYAQIRYRQFLKKLGDKYVLEIPVELIERVFDPVVRAREISQRPKSPDEEIIAEFLDILYDCVGKSDLGIVGSRLLGITGPEHDVDIVILDMDKALAVYDNLAYLKKVREFYFRTPNSVLRRLYENHRESLRVSFDEYRKIAERRILEGCYRGIQYFIRILLVRRKRLIMNICNVRKLFRNYIVTIDFGKKIYTTSLTCPCIYVEYSVPVVTERGVFTETLKILRRVVVCGDLEEVIVNVRDSTKVMRWIYLGPDGWAVPAV